MFIQFSNADELYDFVTEFAKSNHTVQEVRNAMFSIAWVLSNGYTYNKETVALMMLEAAETSAFSREQFDTYHLNKEKVG